MTIDEAILYMELYKRKLFNSVSDLDKDIEAYDIAIDTMRKYQKIKEQVDIAIDKENFAISGARLIQIREIINRNDD